MKKNSKLVNVLSTAAMVATLVGPLAATPAFADSTNVVSNVPSVSTTYDSNATGSAVSNLIVEENNTSFSSTDRFRVILPSGVKWSDNVASSGTLSTSNPDGSAGSTAATYTRVSDQVLEVNINSVLGTGLKHAVSIPMNVKVDGASGPISVTVDPLDSTVTGGQYVIANVASGSTVATVDSAKTIVAGSSNATIGTVRVDETAVGSVYQTTQQKVTFKLPSNYNWTNNGTVSFAGGFAGHVTVNGKDGVTPVTLSGNSFPVSSAVTSGDRELTFYVSFTSAPTTRGTIYLTGGQVNVDNDAPKGDVTLSVSGDKLSSQDVVVATNGDYSVTPSIDEVKTIVAGQNDSSDKTGTLEIKEDVLNSLVAGRNLEIDLPDSVKLVSGTTLDWSAGSTLPTTPTVNTDRNKITLAIPTTRSTSKYDFKVKLPLEISADYTGDVTATIKGAGIADQKIVIAKAVAPLSLKTTSSSLAVGAANQSASDIVLTEGDKGAFASAKSIFVKLPNGVSFASTPTVTVTSGDVEVDQANVGVTNDTYNPGANNWLEIPIKSDSTKPSTITVSNVKLNVDNTVPAGDVAVKVGGAAVVNSTNAADFTSNAAKTTYATVGAYAANASFAVGKTTFTVNGVEKTMDVAPYTNADKRLMLPARFVANALGVSDDNIIWNNNTQTATIIKGDRIVQFTVNKAYYVLNGVQVSMDTKAEMKDGRNMIPFRYLAQALGAQVSWDDATQTATLK